MRRAALVFPVPGSPTIRNSVGRRIIPPCPAEGPIIADALTRAATFAHSGGMLHGSQDPVAFRLWPPVAIGAPLLVGWLATLVRGDPVELGSWRVPLGWVLMLWFLGWN